MRHASPVFASMAYLLILPATAQANDLYRSIDAQGQVVYSDQPSAGAQKQSLQINEGNERERARLRQEQTLLDARSAEQASQARSRQQAQTQQQVQQQERLGRCEAARARYATFAAGGRVFHSDEQGNRVYYTEQEIEAQRLAAKAATEQICSAS